VLTALLAFGKSTFEGGKPKPAATLLRYCKYSWRASGHVETTLSPVEYVYPVQLFLAKGALVLEPNYRGSAGYGAAFRSLDIRNLGIGEMSDVMAGIDHLIFQGIADPTRLAARGSSWGGYISSFLETHTDRFRAISESSGISDTITEYVNTENTPLMPQFLQATRGTT
jgi:dipeptidyl aminopeptidase/acylaminoacyl peptidase